MMNKFSIIIPAYNEEEGVKATLEDLKKYLRDNYSESDYEIIVVNDGSTDKTKEILETISGITLINHHYNKGYGAALKTGIKNSKNDWILILDADGTYPIESIS